MPNGHVICWFSSECTSENCEQAVFIWESGRGRCCNGYKIWVLRNWFGLIKMLHLQLLTICFDALLSGHGGSVAMVDYFVNLPATSCYSGLLPVIEASREIYLLLAVSDVLLYNHLVLLLDEITIDLDVLARADLLSFLKDGM